MYPGYYYAKHLYILSHSILTVFRCEKYRYDPLECRLHKGKAFCLFCSLLDHQPQEQYLTHNKYLINIC